MKNSLWPWLTKFEFLGRCFDIQNLFWLHNIRARIRLGDVQLCAIVIYGAQRYPVWGHREVLLVLKSNFSLDGGKIFKTDNHRFFFNILNIWIFWIFENVQIWGKLIPVGRTSWSPNQSVTFGKILKQKINLIWLLWELLIATSTTYLGLSSLNLCTLILK